jgi:uncharacterized protein (DUF305 family)
MGIAARRRLSLQENAMATALRFHRSLCALALCGAGLLSAAGAWAQAASQPMHGGGMDMHGVMMQGAQAMQQMKPSGDIDRDFATMMRMHHQQAVEMAQAYLKQARSPEMKKMAHKIIRDQQREVAQFDKWLQAHK